MPDIYVAHSKSESQSESQKEEPKPKSVSKTMHNTKPQTETGTKLAENHKEKFYHPLSAFFLFPKNKVEFETREPKEKIILLLRRHPITNLPWMTIAAVMIAAPLVLNFFPLLAFLPKNFQFIAVVSWYLVTTAYILENFLSWFFNVNIITDERIIDVDFYNLIYKKVSDAKIDNIEDKTYIMGGVVRALFNYGDVSIQTAAEEREFEFAAVPRPSEVIRILDDLVIEEEQEKIEGRVR